ncbi:MAG: hypothetical protein K2X86_01075 [Cytophagaceae bacterium]|nr:hypothetical protein [Cytophagaceae bacterium]
MKHILLVLSLFCVTLVTNLAKAQHEINKLDTQVEVLLDSAAKHMISFIVTQNESEYNASMEKISRAQSINEELIQKNKAAKGTAMKLEDELLEERKEEFDSYKDQSLKSTVMGEKPEQRKIKVKFKGQSYNIGEKSKKYYDIFTTYLPKN